MYGIYSDRIPHRGHNYADTGRRGPGSIRTTFDHMGETASSTLMATASSIRTEEDTAPPPELSTNVTRMSSLHQTARPVTSADYSTSTTASSSIVEHLHALRAATARRDAEVLSSGAPDTRRRPLVGVRSPVFLSNPEASTLHQWQERRGTYGALEPHSNQSFPCARL